MVDRAVASHARRCLGGPWLCWAVVAVVVRLAAAAAVEWLARSRGQLCLFDDTRVYWYLAGQLRDGLPYMVPQYDIPHFALRTPGYPLFLAACRLVTDAPILPRLVQAVLGGVGVGLLARLVHQLVGHAPGGKKAANWAGGIAACEPLSAGLSVLLLSESLFMPLLLLGLSLLEWLTRPRAAAGTGSWVRAGACGVVQGATVLVRPSWLLFVPLATAWAGWAPSTEPGRARLRNAAFLLLGFVIIMTPWWVRNSRVTGRFVPTALWMGASLYDGLNPRATGASDMRFMDDPEIRRLDESTQDRVLRDRALAFARENPMRVVELAAIKMARFWSPWPNARELGSVAVAVGCAVATLPLYGLMLLGAWRLRRQWRALFLLAGPLLYVACLHLLFVGSIRYRIAAEVPALGLAAVALSRGD